MMRSALFLPGNRPGLLITGTVLDADALIFDLEDAVAPSEKDAARLLVASALRHLDFGQRRKIVRINALDGPEFAKDLPPLLAAGIDALMPPKIHRPEDLDPLLALLEKEEAKAGLPLGQTQLIPLIESAEGVLHAAQIAKASPRILGLLLGAEDLAANLEAERSQDGEEIAFARAQVVMAAKAAGIKVLDTPYTDTQNLQGLKADARKAKALGFTGKAVIFPGHLAAVNAAFSPSAEAIAYALEVMATMEAATAEGLGAVALRGKMIDQPIVLRAQQCLAEAKALGLLPTEGTLV